MKIKSPLTLIAACGGWTMAGGLYMAFQDYMGLEGYIAYLPDHWIHMSPLWGLAVAVIGAVGIFFAGFAEGMLTK